MMIFNVTAKNIHIITNTIKKGTHLWLLNAGKIFLHIEKNKQKTKTRMDHNAHLRYSSFAQKDDYVIILIKRKKNRTILFDN